ncbi:MAG: ferredoxin [Acidobacteriota bacterium]
MSETDSTLQRTIAGLNVVIDRDACISIGACTKTAPEVFEFDDRQVVRFLSEIPDDVDRDSVLEACGVCPVQALSAFDADGDQLAP